MSRIRQRCAEASTRAKRKTRVCRDSSYCRKFGNPIAIWYFNFSLNPSYISCPCLAWSVLHYFRLRAWWICVAPPAIPGPQVLIHKRLFLGTLPRIPSTNCQPFCPHQASLLLFTNFIRWYVPPKFTETSVRQFICSPSICKLCLYYNFRYYACINQATRLYT
jgi:hypothetical protein